MRHAWRVLPTPRENGRRHRMGCAPIGSRIALNGTPRRNTGDYMVSILPRIETSSARVFPSSRTPWETEGPTWRSVPRCGTFSDLVGEKLSDAFVAECMELSRCSGALIPVRQPAPGYLLLAEEERDTESVARLEAMLCRNPQYAYARKMRQLRPLEARHVLDLAKRTANHASARGMRLGDVKILTLCSNPEWLGEEWKL